MDQREFDEVLDEVDRLFGGCLATLIKHPEFRPGKFTEDQQKTVRDVFGKYESLLRKIGITI